MGTLVIERVVRLYVRDLLQINDDITMHIISYLSSMDETIRLLLQVVAEAIEIMDALPTYNYLALKITSILYYYLLLPSDVLHSYK